MNFKHLSRALACAVLVGLASGCGNASSPEPPQRNVGDVLSNMRVKQLTKALDLTEEQQAQVKVLADDEAREIAKIHDASDLSMTQQSVKIGELRKEIYIKIKPLLNPVQLEKLEKMLSKPERKR